VSPEPNHQGPPLGNGHPDASVEELNRLKELLLGPERRRLEEAERRLEAGFDAERMAEHLPEAIAVRARRDRQLARALSPTIEGALNESVRRNPREIATAIFPVLGPAIRKAIAEAMAGLVRSINTAVEHSLSLRGLRWRLEAWRTGVPYPQIVLKHALVYRVEQVFLIHADTGLLLVRASPPDLPLADADLIAGMLTAIQDFVSDSFAVEAEGARLRTFSVGELTVLVERGPLAILAAVVRGQPPDALLSKLQDTLGTVHLQFGDLLRDFSGEVTPFKAVAPLLEDCLETVLVTDQPGRGGRLSWLRWTIPLAILIGAAGWLWWRAERRWDLARARLAREPGVVVVEADRGFRRWRFSGLLDPAARDPKTVLAAEGIDTARVETSWRPFLSLEGELLLARARRTLAPPSTVTLELAGDSLRARGQATTEWLGSARRQGPIVSGMTPLDLSAVAVLFPAALEPVRAAMETTLIYFPLASDEPLPGTVTRLDRIAAATAVLDSAIRSDGYRLNLELVGRSDSSGSDTINRPLSQLRAEVVRDRLLARNIPAEISAVGVDNSDPLPGTDPSDEARRNRTVSLKVHLVPGTKSKDRR
jgi:OOP family OmpA-OmpF porin